MRIAIYARVSTDDKGQNPENQLIELRQWCARAGHEIVREYIDLESGRKGTDKRKQFAALFEDASKRTFDIMLFWSLDRFSREGMVPTIMHLQRLASYGVGFRVQELRNQRLDNLQPLDLWHVPAVFDDLNSRIGNAVREFLGID